MEKCTNVVVERVSPPKATKKPGSFKYSFALNGAWYASFEDPQVKEGDCITFDYEVSKWGNTIKGPITKVAAGASPAASPVTDPNPTMFTPAGPSNTQLSIERQSARKDALVAVNFLVEGGHVSLGAKMDKKVENYLGYVEAVQARFINGPEEGDGDDPADVLTETYDE